MNGGIILFEKIHGQKDIGSSRIRGHWLVKYWPELEVYKYGKKYDFLIFQKAYLLELAEKFDGIKIVDICDPDWVELQPIREMIGFCDAVTCPTEPLAEVFRNLTDKPVVVISDRMDLEHYREKKQHRGRAREVVWHGYAHNSYALKKTVRTLLRLNLKLSIISNEYVSVAGEEGYEGRRLEERWTKWELSTFNKEFIKSDIFLNPVGWRPNDRFKSNNRELTAWALGMPVARTAEDLERLMDPVERQKEADRNLREVREKYDVRQSVGEFKRLIEELKNGRR